MSEPSAQLRDAHCSDLRPHVLVTMNKDAGEESLHCLLQLVLVPSEVPSLRDEFLQLGLPGLRPSHQLTLTLGLNLTLPANVHVCVSEFVCSMYMQVSRRDNNYCVYVMCVKWLK